MFEEAGTARTQLLAHLGFNVRQDENGNASNGIEKKLTSTLGLEDVGESSAFPIDNDEAFFNNIQPSVGGFSDNDAPNGKETLTEAAEHLDSSEHSVDNKIQRALVVGDYKEAVLQCISAHRMADALVIANLGGSSLWESTRDQYLKKSLSPYLKVVSAMVSNDLMGLVTTRPLDSWKETLALLCTFAQKEDWTLLCDTLASRLRTAGNTLAATLCYICAGNIDKTVEIWSCNLKSEHEGKSYVDLLQDLMEKKIVLALAIGQKGLSASLSKLVENYDELLASQGLLTTGMEYLKLLGSEELSHELFILQNRIALSAEVEMRPVVATLTRLYNETSEALGGVHANPSKKREIEDNSKKIGSLFAKLNRGDLSPNAASKLRQLCKALDASDFASALHTQVLLTTSDWDECNFWLAALKRMIKTKHSDRL